MGDSFLNKFLSKRVCVDTHNHCSFKEPYSELQFLNKNEAIKFANKNKIFR